MLVHIDEKRNRVQRLLDVRNQEKLIALKQTKKYEELKESRKGVKKEEKRELLINEIISNQQQLILDYQRALVNTGTAHRSSVEIHSISKREKDDLRKSKKSQQALIKKREIDAVQKTRKLDEDRKDYIVQKKMRLLMNREISQSEREEVQLKRESCVAKQTMTRKLEQMQLQNQVMKSSSPLKEFKVTECQESLITRSQKVILYATVIRHPSEPKRDVVNTAAVAEVYSMKKSWDRVMKELIDNTISRRRGKMASRKEYVLQSAENLEAQLQRLESLDRERRPIDKIKDKFKDKDKEKEKSESQIQKEFEKIFLVSHHPPPADVAPITNRRATTLLSNRLSSSFEVGSEKDDKFEWTVFSSNNFNNNNNNNVIEEKHILESNREAIVHDIPSATFRNKKNVSKKFVDNDRVEIKTSINNNNDNNNNINSNNNNVENPREQLHVKKSIKSSTASSVIGAVYNNNNVPRDSITNIQKDNNFEYHAKQSVVPSPSTHSVRSYNNSSSDRSLDDIENSNYILTPSTYNNNNNNEYSSQVEASTTLKTGSEYYTNDSSSTDIARHDQTNLSDSMQQSTNWLEDSDIISLLSEDNNNNNNPSHNSSLKEPSNQTNSIIEFNDSTSIAESVISHSSSQSSSQSSNSQDDNSSIPFSMSILSADSKTSGKASPLESSYSSDNDMVEVLSSSKASQREVINSISVKTNEITTPTSKLTSTISLTFEDSSNQLDTRKSYEDSLHNESIMSQLDELSRRWRNLSSGSGKDRESSSPEDLSKGSTPEKKSSSSVGSDRSQPSVVVIKRNSDAVSLSGSLSISSNKDLESAEISLIEASSLISDNDSLSNESGKTELVIQELDRITDRYRKSPSPTKESSQGLMRSGFDSLNLGRHSLDLSVNMDRELSLIRNNVVTHSRSATVTTSYPVTTEQRKTRQQEEMQRPQIFSTLEEKRRQITQPTDVSLVRSDLRKRGPSGELEKTTTAALTTTTTTVLDQSMSSSSASFSLESSVLNTSGSSSSDRQQEQQNQEDLDLSSVADEISPDNSTVSAIQNEIKQMRQRLLETVSKPPIPVPIPPAPVVRFNTYVSSHTYAAANSSHLNQTQLSVPSTLSDGIQSITTDNSILMYQLSGETPSTSSGSPSKSHSDINKFSYISSSVSNEVDNQVAVSSSDDDSATIHNLSLSLSLQDEDDNNNMSYGSSGNNSDEDSLSGFMPR